MVLPDNFACIEGAKYDKKLGALMRIELHYKGELIAVFESADEYLPSKVLNYIETYGYLAEWTYQKYVQGRYVNWSDDMKIDTSRWHHPQYYPEEPGEYKTALEPSYSYSDVRRYWNGSTWSNPYMSNWSEELKNKIRAEQSSFLVFWKNVH